MRKIMQIVVLAIAVMFVASLGPAAGEPPEEGPGLNPYPGPFGSNEDPGEPLGPHNPYPGPHDTVGKS